MRIVELILDEAQSMMGIEAISIVENPAIEENFLALKSDEIKLAEVNKEKKILMGALLIPNKPIYRKAGKDEYYIYFSKETVEKASQLYLKNGNQNNSTLEHKHELSGLTLVESWIVEDTKFDKSRKYGLDVPVGTWMVSMKVNNDEIWNDYVKTGEVKGFSIEGFFADKMERPQDNTTGLSEEEADLLLSQITSIVKGEQVELNAIEDLKNSIESLQGITKNLQGDLQSYVSLQRRVENEISEGDTRLKQIKSYLQELQKSLRQLGLDENSVPDIKISKRVIRDYESVSLSKRGFGSKF